MERRSGIGSRLAGLLILGCVLALPASAQTVIRDSIGCDASGDNCTNAATDNGEVFFNVDGFVLVYDLGLSSGQTVRLKEIRIVAVDDFGNPIDTQNLTFTLRGWSSLSQALGSPRRGGVVSVGS